MLATSIALASGLALVACGGGGGVGGVADISGSGVVSGPIDNFGSIIANGVRMDVNGATITDDGVSIIQSDLDVGDTVIMRGTLNGDGTGSAVTVITDEFVKGPVTAIDVPGNRFVAMGQTINVDLTTAFSGITLDTLTAGMLVEVHGSLDGDDEVRATRVELKTSLDEFELTGVIDSSTPTTFVINGMVVNYASADVETESGSLSAGLYVDVAASSAPTASTLTATSVQEESRTADAQPGDEAEIEGLITAVLSPTRFRLNGLIVEHDASTSFERGSAARLVVNARVEVEGRVDSTGVLRAREIKLEDQLNIRINTALQSVDAGAGTLTVLGKTFQTDASTQFEDERDGLEPFRINDLRVGDYVEMRAYLDGATLRASRVERDENDSRLELRGPLDSDNGTNSLTILGISVSTDFDTEFEGLDDSSISSSEFYTTVSAGDVVEIRQDISGGPIVADEVEIEELVP